MTNVVNLGAVIGSRIELPAQQVLQAAIDGSISPVIVVGLDPNGALYHASSVGAPETALMLAAALNRLAGDVG